MTGSRPPPKSRAGNLWNRIDKDIELKKYETAGKLLNELVSRYSGSGVVKRNRKAIERYKRRLESFSPAVQAGIIGKLCREAAKVGAGPRALNLAMTAYSRYGELKSLDSGNKAEIRENVKLALDMLRERTRVKAVSDNQVPFYNGGADNPGDAWIFEQIIRNRKVLGSSHPILPFLVLAAEIDLGDWRQTEAILTKHGQDFYYLTKDIGPMKSWAPSLLFGLGIAAKRYPEKNLKPKISQALFEMPDEFSDAGMRTRSAILAMEYALAIRAPESAEHFAANYNFGKNHTVLDGKIALLHLLALIRQDKSDAKKFLRVLQGYRKIFKDSADLQNDFSWCSTAVTYWMKGGTGGTGRIDTLRKWRCSAPEITARILSAAIARGLLSRKPVGKENWAPVLDLLEKQVGGNLMCGPLWFAVVTLRLSAASGQTGFAAEIDRALRDYRICAIKYYPRLRMLNAGKEIFRQNLPAGEVAAIYERFIAGCPVANRTERDVPQLLEGKIPPAETVKRLFREDCPEEGFWCGITMLLSYTDKVKTSEEICKVFRSNSNRLSWEERLLLKSLEEKLK